MNADIVQRTREHFAENERGRIAEVKNGQVKLPSHVDPLVYFAECETRAAEYLAGKSDHTLTFRQRAVWIQTGVMHALLP